eukprot:1114113-Rhodomonas_salina.1
MIPAALFKVSTAQVAARNEKTKHAGLVETVLSARGNVFDLGRCGRCAGMACCSKTCTRTTRAPKPYLAGKPPHFERVE